ncbi:hypothetical protein SFRURICE_013233, partial [Spodoptera frugiperda]
RSITSCIYHILFKPKGEPPVNTPEMCYATLLWMRLASTNHIHCSMESKMVPNSVLLLRNFRNSEKCPVILYPTRESNPRPLVRQSHLRPHDQRGSHVKSRLKMKYKAKVFRDYIERTSHAGAISNTESGIVPDILATQRQLIEAINGLHSNFKKDGAERKTSDYLRRRLATLEQYYTEFHNNHMTLLSFGDKSHTYFSTNQYDQITEKYKLIKSTIESYTPLANRPQTPVLKPPTFEPTKSQTSNINVASTSTPTATKISLHDGNEIESRFKKQATNFKAFLRTTSNIDLDLVSEKWEFEDILKTLQSRWEAIDSLHWELDNEYGGSNPEYEEQFTHYEKYFQQIKKDINKKIKPIFSKSPNKYPNKNPKTNYSTNQVSQSSKSKRKTSYRKQCIICNSNDHRIHTCQKLMELQPYERKNTITNLKLCTNCLHYHDGKKCLSEIRCKECNSEHNTILHDAFAPHRSGSNAATIAKTPSHQLQQDNDKVAALRKEPSEILLATAIIEVQAVDGSYQKMRVLLDQGSQTSIIREGAAQLLKLPRRRCHGYISGIGNKENNCKGKITIKCSSLVNDFTFETEVYIMNKLINNLPSYTLPKPDWPVINQITLADPEFYKSRPIDILFGADVYSTQLVFYDFKLIQRQEKAGNSLNFSGISGNKAKNIINIHRPRVIFSEQKVDPVGDKFSIQKGIAARLAYH